MKQKIKNAAKKILITALAFGLIFGGMSLISLNVNATSWCTTEKCQAAEAAEEEATKKASEASEAADTLDGEINRLNQEIQMYEARIVANRAKAEDLRGQIAENTKKLELQKDALTSMIIDMYLDGDTDELMVLASSESLSDYADKQTRLDSARDKISTSAQMVQTLKEDLEAQKKEVDRIVADQELQQSAIEQTKQREETLVAQYKANAEAYTAEAEEARKTKEAEIAEAIRKANSTGAIGNGTNTYPKRSSCPADDLRYIFGGGYVCQCTSYAAWKVKERYGISISAWGDAKNWGASASSLGYRVDKTPEAGSVAYTTSGSYGHVMWIESVNSNGTVNLSEYNNSYSSASHRWGDFGYRIGVSTGNMRFIHFN